MVRKGTRRQNRFKVSSKEDTEKRAKHRTLGKANRYRDPRGTRRIEDSKMKSDQRGMRKATEEARRRDTKGNGEATQENIMVYRVKGCTYVVECKKSKLRAVNSTIDIIKKSKKESLRRVTLTETRLMAW